MSSMNRAPTNDKTTPTTLPIADGTEVIIPVSETLPAPQLPNPHFAVWSRPLLASFKATAGPLENKKTKTTKDNIPDKNFRYCGLDFFVIFTFREYLPAL
jgi:hypothetical protein